MQDRSALAALAVGMVFRRMCRSPPMYEKCLHRCAQQHSKHPLQTESLAAVRKVASQTDCGRLSHKRTAKQQELKRTSEHQLPRTLESQVAQEACVSTFELQKLGRQRLRATASKDISMAKFSAASAREAIAAGQVLLATKTKWPAVDTAR